jgi:hypothetical protein
VRLLLDEGLPSVPGFRPEALDASVTFVTLRELDPKLATAPDWYVVLRAAEGGFDALVTLDGRHVEQPEETWALWRGGLSIVTWRRPPGDPVTAWAQLVAHVPEVRRVLAAKGPSVVSLPTPRLGGASVEPAGDVLDRLAAGLGVSDQALRNQARAVVRAGLDARGQLRRFGAVVA